MTTLPRNYLCLFSAQLLVGLFISNAYAENQISYPLIQQESAYAEILSDLDMPFAIENGHLSQKVVKQWGESGSQDEHVQFLFDFGDELSEIQFTRADGVGSHVLPDGERLLSTFSRTPTGGRMTGPNAQSCVACHNVPLGNGAGHNIANVMQDPDPQTAGLFNARQTIAINGGGIIQILAEEMTTELQHLKNVAIQNPGLMVPLDVKEGVVSFGSIQCHVDETCNFEKVIGISPDLIVRPQGWKGNFPTMRGFSADAALGEMGMEPEELAWKLHTPRLSGERPLLDGDGDGVSLELSVGDITALTIYMAMQETPTTLPELDEEGSLILSSEDKERIHLGEELFSLPIEQGGAHCSSCHAPAITVDSTLFMEPSNRASLAYVDQDLMRRDPSYSPLAPITIDLSSDLVDQPRVKKLADGSTVLHLFSDLKRHKMGEYLADNAKQYFPLTAGLYKVTELPDDADEASKNSLSTLIRKDEFLTPELWGVGSTGPWLHDGRATTLKEAIEFHGGEAEEHAKAFTFLAKPEQDAVIAFLLNLIYIDKVEDETNTGGHSETEELISAISQM